MIPNSDSLGEDVKPFLPRFLLQELIVAHCPFDDLYPDQPDDFGKIFCCRTDWLQLRRTVDTQCAILPIREIAAFPRPSSNHRPTARWSLPAQEPMDEFRCRPGQMPRNGSASRADSPCSGRTDSIYDSDPDLCKWDLDVAGDYRPYVPKPLLQPAVPLRPRLLLEELILAHCPSQPRSAEVPTPNPTCSLRSVAITERVIVTIQAIANC